MTDKAKKQDWDPDAAPNREKFLAWRRSEDAKKPKDAPK